MFRLVKTEYQIVAEKSQRRFRSKKTVSQAERRYRESRTRERTLHRCVRLGMTAGLSPRDVASAVRPLIYPVSPLEELSQVAKLLVPVDTGRLRGSIELKETPNGA